MLPVQAPVSHLWQQSYTAPMPTAKPRHVITESEAVREALDAGQRRWPALSRGRVASRLVEEAGQALEREEQQRVQRRRELLSRPPSGPEQWFPAGYLEDLREDFPQ